MVIRIVLLLSLLFLPAVGARADSLRLLVPEVSPVVGEMIPVVVRGEYTSRIALERLTFPDSDSYDWMQLARDSWREERVNGRQVLVLERRIALFPRTSGPIRIGPLSHHLTVATDGGGRETLDVPADALTVEVAPFPADGVPLAASALTLEDTLSASPGELRDGETLLRRVTLRADDTLPHFLPPRPRIRAPWLITFAAPEVREMKPTPEGPETTVTWEWHFRPKTGEPAVLPPVDIAWFDTRSRLMRTAQIPAIPFGYASFDSNRTGSGHLPRAQFVTASSMIAAGFIAGLTFAFAGASPRRKAQVLKSLKRLLPFDPTRKALKSAARTGDLAALRAASEHYLARRRDLGLKVPDKATADLDRAIYAQSGAPAFDAERYRRRLIGRKE